MVDRQYCSAEHRKEARLASAQALRDEDEQELWSVSKNNKKKTGTANASAGQTASLFAFLTVAALLVAALMLPGPGTSYSGPSASLDPALKRGLVERASDALGEMVRSRAPVTLHHDFRTGLSDWITVGLHGNNPVDDPRGWNTASAPELVAPGSLRLWTSSISLVNYQMEFQGEIEKKSLSWAFRAADPSNYYASKIVITKPGPQPNAGLVHYVMLNGHEWDRVQLPLPLTLERGGSYRVRVSVQDDRFVTYLNGQVVGSWSDKRLPRGGIGFFADQEDQQQVAWVSLSERDSFLGRMLAHFSLVMVPGPIR